MKNITRSASIVLALATSLTAACGGATADFTPDHDAPASADVDGQRPAPAATPEPAAPTPEPVTAPFAGEVWVTQFDDSVEGQQRPVVLGSLWRNEEHTITSGCRSAMVAGCEVRRCEAGVESTPIPERVAASAGDMRIDGLSVGAIPLAPVGSWYGPTALEPFGSQRRAWAGGERVELRAAGDVAGAPAFALSAVAPAPITVTSASYEGRRLARGVEALDLAWSGGDDALVRVQFGDAGTVDGETTRVRCEFPASAGHASVPAAALASLPSAGPVQLYVMSVASTRARSADLDVTFTLKHVARAGLISVQ